MTTDTKIVGRLAPSPTGAQHLGNARTYLIAWLSARSQGGRVVLRIEDIDASRVRLGAIESAIDDLRWLGLDCDGEPVIQTQRLTAHRDALERLKAAELVYPCTCTRSDIERAASAPHAENEGPIYPRLCAHRRASDAESLGSRPFAWRMRTTDETITFDDGLCGPQPLNLNQIGGDFVVWKNDDSPAYQLAVVVDDADAGVTEVIRGDDLIPSTPRQLLIYRALGLTPPRFTHVPLVIGEDGRRLAKRHGDTRLSLLREAGVAPEAVIGLLSWSCGWIDDIMPMRADDLVERFRLDTIPRRPFVLTREMLKRIGYC